MVGLLRKNIANLLTLTRLLCVIFLLIEFNHFFNANIKKEHITIGLLILMIICLSDFFDGRVARRLNITSDFGANFDVFTDIFYVISLIIRLCFIGWLPVWFLILVIEKTANYFITSALIQKNNADKFAYIKDPIGRIVTASYFFVPIAVFILNTFFLEYHYLIFFLLIPQAVFGLISSGHRIFIVRSASITQV